MASAVLLLGCQQHPLCRRWPAVAELTPKMAAEREADVRALSEEGFGGENMVKEPPAKVNYPEPVADAQAPTDEAETGQTTDEAVAQVDPDVASNADLAKAEADEKARVAAKAEAAKQAKDAAREEAKRAREEERKKRREAQLATAKIYNARCSTCHGSRGRGDGPATARLTPKPQDFGDPKWQKSVSNRYIENVIVKGGVSVGKSPLMPPHPDLKKNAAELRRYVRRFRK
ncbi:MAG: cytochrome c [Myxococcales bacterium]|nr:cytochrome c [Myxococcales bacterium]